MHDISGWKAGQDRKLPAVQANWGVWGLSSIVSDTVCVVYFDKERLLVLAFVMKMEEFTVHPQIPSLHCAWSALKVELSTTLESVLPFYAWKETRLNWFCLQPLDLDKEIIPSDGKLWCSCKDSFFFLLCFCSVRPLKCQKIVRNCLEPKVMSVGLTNSLKPTGI